MPPLRLAQDIRPVTDLKAHGAEIVRQVEEGRPVVLSRHGRAVAVMLSASAYDELMAQTDTAALRRAVSEAEAELEGGGSLAHDEVRSRLQGLLDEA